MILTIPRGFQPHDYLLTGRLVRHPDDARWLLHAIITKTAAGEAGQDGFVRIPATELNRWMLHKTRAAIVAALADDAARPPAIIRDKSRGGTWHDGFKLSNHFRDAPTVNVPAIDPRFLRRAARNQGEQRT